MKFKDIKKKLNNLKFPSNSRSIPAFVKTSAGKPGPFKFKLSSAMVLKIYRGSLKVFIAFIFILTAIVVGLDLQDNLRIKKEIASQRESLQNDLYFWESFIQEHENYIDAYFQASILEYKLGSTSKAKMYVEKGLLLDPNSEDGRKIEEFLSK